MNIKFAVGVTMGVFVAGLGLPAFADDDVLCVQQELVARGMDPGPLDGVMGGRTRTASRTAAADAALQLAPLTTSNAEQWCLGLRVARAEPLSVAELTELMAGKTRTYNNGNKVFLGADGKMMGVVANGNTVARDGTWAADDDGRVCFDVHYRNKGSVLFDWGPGFHAVECRDHRKLDGIVYEVGAEDGSGPVDLNGEWNILQTADPADDDKQSQQFAEGDTVSARIEDVLAAWNSPAPDPSQYGQRLLAADLQASLFGHTIAPETTPNTIRVNTDGSATILRASGENSDGRAWLDGDSFCMQIPEADATRCYLVHRNGNQYAMLFPDSSLNYAFAVK